MKESVGNFFMGRRATIRQPSFQRPDIGLHWMQKAQWAERMGLSEPAAKVLKWAIDNELVPEENLELAHNTLLGIAHKAQLFNLCEYSAKLRGKNAEEFMEGSNNFNLISDLVTGPYREGVRKRLVKGLESEIGDSPFLKAVHNFLVSGPETLPKTNGDTFWAANKLLTESQVKLSQRDKLAPNSAYNLAFERTRADLPESSPKVTIIMPCYNAEETVAHAINAVLAQSYENFELLVVDDGSSDNSRQIIERLEAEDSRVRLIALERNQGTYAARNTALAEAVGEYVLVVDADDIPFPNLLQTHIQALLENDELTAVISRAIKLTPDLRILNLAVRNVSSLTFKRRAVVDEIGYWDRSARVSADTEFLMRMQSHFGEERVLQIDQILALYVAQDKSLTRSGEFDLVFSRRSAGGYRNIYRSEFEKWHSSGQRLYCSKEKGLGLMKNYLTSHSPSKKNHDANFIIHLHIHNAKVYRRLRRAIDNQGYCVVASSSCVFSIGEDIAEEYKCLLKKGEMRLATLSYIRNQTGVVHEECGGRKYFGLKLASFCGCENRISTKW